MKKIYNYFLSFLLHFSIISNRLSDRLFLKIRYKKSFGEQLNLDNPKTFNEKLQWLKLYDRKDIYTTMVDKYAVKNYVANLVGKKYIIPTIGTYDKFDDIDFAQLPNQFVIKTTHDSGGIVICKNKKELNMSFAKNKINKSLSTNYYLKGREWPYKNVKPRIIIEKYMEDQNCSSMRDYKFFCFNGVAKYILVCTDRESELKETFYDVDWNLASFKRPTHDIDCTIEKPKNLKIMIKLANMLSVAIPFLRVDFYEINGEVYFGELTFYPASGFEKFEPQKWDYLLGNMINLKEVGCKNNEKEKSTI